MKAVHLTSLIWQLSDKRATQRGGGRAVEDSWQQSCESVLFSSPLRSMKRIFAKNEKPAKPFKVHTILRIHFRPLPRGRQ
jgi:hypothetical protein